MKKRILIIIAFLCVSAYFLISNSSTTYAGNAYSQDDIKNLEGTINSIKYQYELYFDKPLTTADELIYEANILCSSDGTLIWDDLFDNDGIVGNNFSEERYIADGDYILFQPEADAKAETNRLILLRVNNFAVEDITDKSEVFDLLDQMDQSKNDGILQDFFRQSIGKDEFLSNSNIKIILKDDRFQIKGMKNPNSEGENTLSANTLIDDRLVRNLTGVLSSIKEQFLMAEPYPLEDADELITYANFLSRTNAIFIWDDLFDNDGIVGNSFSSDRYYADDRYILFQTEADVASKDDTLILIDIIDLTVKKLSERSDVFDILAQMDKGNKSNEVQDTFKQKVSKSKFLKNTRIKILLKNDRFQITGGSDPNGPKIHVKKVILDEKSISLKQGEKYKLSAIVMPYDSTVQKVTWSSDHTSIASIDSKGNVTAKKVGTANIKVITTDGNKTYTCKVTVTKNPNYYTVGQTATLYCARKDEGITWSVSNTDIVQIIDKYDKTCTIKCLKPGTVTVIAYVDTYEYYYDPFYEVIDRKLVRLDYVHYEIIVVKKD